MRPRLTPSLQGRPGLTGITAVFALGWVFFLGGCDEYLTEITTEAFAPVITSFDLSPNSLNLTESEGTITASVNIRDESAVDSVQVTLGSADGDESVCTAHARGSGSSASATWSCSLTFLPDADAGLWTVRSASVFQESVVVTQVSGADLQQAGFPTFLRLVRVERVVVTPEVDTITYPEDSTRFSALSYDNFNEVVPDAPVIWTTSDASVAVVDSTGGVTRTGRGQAMIHASVGSVIGSALVTVLVPVASVVVDPDRVELATGGETTLLQATVTGLDGNAQPDVPVSWTSADNAVASVDGTGLVTAVGAGTTTVSATVEGVSGSAVIVVLEEPATDPTLTTIIVTPSDTVLTTAGELLAFQARAVDELGADMDGITFLWASSDPTLATVDQTGVAVAVASGQVSITAAAEGVVGSAILRVEIAPAPEPVVTRVEVSPDSILLQVLGATATLTATVFDQNDLVMLGEDVVWSSTTPAVASVDGTGLVTAIGAGTTTVSATVQGVSGSTVIVVAEEPAPDPTLTEIIVTPSDTVLTTAGELLAFQARAIDELGADMDGITFLWASSDPSVATVDQTGVAVAVASGQVSITASAEGIVGSAILRVEIAPEPVVTRIEVSPDSVLLQVLGATATLTATVFDQDDLIMLGEDVVWSTTTPAVASVNSTGLVTAVSEGETIVLATIGDVSGSAVVTVTVEQPDPPVATTVVVDPATAEAPRAAQRQFSASVFDQYGVLMPDAPVLWASSNQCIASVDAAGLVTTYGGGLATIRATSGDATGSGTITVEQPLEGVPASVAGTWRMCRTSTGEHIKTLDLVHDAGTTQVTGTVTHMNGSTSVLSGSWTNDVLSVSWAELVSGGERTFSIVGGTALNQDSMTASYNDRRELSTYDVVLTRLVEAEAGAQSGPSAEDSGSSASPP